MSIAQTVRQYIEAERKQGKTYQDISNRHKLNQPYIVNLVNGKRPWSGLSLGVVDRMFPHATVDLDGRSSIVASRVASPGDGDITYGDKSEALRSAIIGAIIDLDISADVLAKVLKTVKNTSA